MKPRARKLSFVIFGVFLAMALAEALVRQLLPGSQSDLQAMPMAEGTLAQFEADEDMGFMPKVGQGGEYCPFGCLANDYDPKSPGDRQRLLFIGDSVTHRHKIIDGLRKFDTQERFEFWNAGVESFNTAQSLELFKRHNIKLKPDHVILTFHNNDFSVTPVAVIEDGQLVIYQPQRPVVRNSSSLFRHSALYRLFLRAWLAAGSERSKDQVYYSLKELKELVENQGGRFSVILFPVLKPESEWEEPELESRRLSLEIFQELEIEYFDLMETAQEAIAKGLDIRETPNDIWHPNDLGGDHFAKTLVQAGLLE